MNIQKKTAGPSSKPRKAPRVDVSSAGRLVPTATPPMHPGREADDRPAKTTLGSAGPALQSDGLIRDRFHLNPCCLNTSHLSTIYLFTFRVFCDGGVNHAGRQLAARSSEGGGVSLRDTSTLSEEEPGIKLATERLIVNSFRTRLIIVRVGGCVSKMLTDRM